jgi:fucose 4-O-acetylase-like acetyltransferase
MKNYCDEQGRLYYFDNLKFCLILLVVTGHYIDPFSKLTPAYGSLYFFIYLFHMPLFVFTTGLFSKSLFDGNGRFRTEKLISFFILYAVLSCGIFLIERFLTGKDVSYSLLTNSNASWYLLACVFWYAALPFIKNMNPKIVIPVACLLSVLAGYTSRIGDFLMLSRVLYFAPFFCIGYYITTGDVMKRLSVRPLVRVLAAAFLIILCSCCLLWPEILLPFRGLLTARNSYGVLPCPLMGGLYRLAAYLIAALTGTAFMLVVPSRRVFITKLGASTLQVYIWHLIILRLLAAVHLVPLVAAASESIAAAGLIPLLLAVILTFILSLTPPFGIGIRWLLSLKYRFLFVESHKEDAHV